MDYTAHVRFSSDMLPERDRMSHWREVMARPHLGVDCEPLHGITFRAETSARPLGRLALGSGTVHGASMRRTRELLGDGQNHFRWNIVLAGRSVLSSRGREVILAPGDGVLQSYAETETYTCISSTLLGIRVPREVMSAILPNADDAVARVVPSSNAMLRLLANYWHIADEMDPSLPGPAQNLVASHLCDLLALTLRSALGVPADATRAGVKAAVLHRIKQDIRANLGRDLSLEAVAVRHRLSARHVQRLFEAEGLTLSQFVKSCRLERVREMLRDPRWSACAIAAIALENGFGDVSTFNRAFRRRFGATPSEVRAGEA